MDNLYLIEIELLLEYFMNNFSSKRSYCVITLKELKNKGMIKEPVILYNAEFITNELVKTKKGLRLFKLIADRRVKDVH